MTVAGSHGKLALLPKDIGSLTGHVPSAPTETVFVLGPEGGVSATPDVDFPIVFGRNEPDVHVCVGIEDRHVSRQHGRIEREGGRWVLTNLGRLPIRLPGRSLLLGGESTGLPAGHTPLVIVGPKHEHLVEVRVGDAPEWPDIAPAPSLPLARDVTTDEPYDQPPRAGSPRHQAASPEERVDIQHTGDVQEPPLPELQPLARVEATLGDPLDLGHTPHGHRRVVPITGGTLSGQQLYAEILPGGADWQVVQSGGWVRVEARYTACADDGTLISIVSEGVRHGPPEVMGALLAGQSPDPASYRFRTAIRFEVSEDSAYAWLNHQIAVASAVRAPSAVLLDVYVVG